MANKKLPKYKRDRIFGIENEYGTIEIDLTLDGDFLSNGGFVYNDSDHVEFATPETRNPLDAIIYDKAGEIISQEFAEKLYKNNLDSEGHTFGTHENYFTFEDPYYFESIIPFLITRQIFAGAGHLAQDGTFEISQRSRFLKTVKSEYTQSCRAILCTKDDSLSDTGYRLHLILGDANMCEVAGFLKIGTTGLVIDLLEDHKLPRIDYDSDSAVTDVHAISKKSLKWSLEGISPKKTSAIDVQRDYLKAAIKAYANRDQITNRLLRLWGDTLDKLESDPAKLFGSIDWITKKILIDSYAQKHGLQDSDSALQNINLQYHDVDKNKGLFYALQKAGLTKRITSDAKIQNAVMNPPRDTRAYIRGKLVSKLNSSKEMQDYVSDDYIDWTFLDMMDVCGDFYINISDPFDNYKDQMRLLRKIK